HWWTAPGEREAADAMFAAFKAKHPDVEIVENPVPGGGGVSHRVVLQSRIIAGIPPDTFQTLGGAELKNYVDSGALQPLDDLWAELDYAKVIPGPLAKAVTVNGHPYVVPLNMHIQNILYYNLKLFDELGIKPPTKFDELLAACEAIKAAKPDMVCLGLGSKEKWGDAFVFDSILLEEGGPEYYVKLFKGEIDVANDPVFRAALEKFQKLTPYINSDHAGLTWDQSVALVGSEKAAMVIMGTWAIGAFVKGSNWQPGVDFGAVTFPQVPERILLFHPDCYGLATNAPNPEVTLDWLRVVASPELQIPTDVTQGGLFA
ncbi:MAG: extracellular solute-binding protein, partial [Anaerolineales bacterium]|nr:extracellular solute-binding protein [Anaerolineales bacterium]MDW8163090.1 extracellular solute-binding protein [Anaerolineales bacterium]